MTYEIKTLIISFVITNLVLSIFIPEAIASSNNIEKCIQVESEIQYLDVQENIITFTGNVIAFQDKIKINADKILVTHANGQKGQEIIDGYGNPVTFYQMEDNGKFIKGRASRMHYELARSLLTLTGNACLERYDGLITGNKITILLKEKKIQAYSGKGNRVTTVFITPILHKVDNHTHKISN